MDSLDKLIKTRQEEISNLEGTLRSKMDKLFRIIKVIELGASDRTHFLEHSCTTEQIYEGDYKDLHFKVDYGGRNMYDSQSNYYIYIGEHEVFHCETDSTVREPSDLYEGFSINKFERGKWMDDIAYISKNGYDKALKAYRSEANATEAHQKELKEKIEKLDKRKNELKKLDNGFGPYL